MWFTQNRSPLPPSRVFINEGKTHPSWSMLGLSQMNFEVFLLSPAGHENEGGHGRHSDMHQKPGFTCHTAG